MAPAHARVPDELRVRIACIEHAGWPQHPVESLGVPEIDVRMSQGGLGRGNSLSACEGARIQAVPSRCGPGIRTKRR